MKVFVVCIPCFVKQITEIAKIVSNDQDFQMDLLRDALATLSNIPFHKLKPPQVAKRLHELVKEKSGIDDPYLEIKKRSDALAKRLTDELKKLVKESDDPFEIALRLAIAGNIIDYGQARNVDDSIVEKTIQETLDAKLDKRMIKALYLDIKKSSSILYIGDNAGEIYFDKLFLQMIPNSSITFVVRGRPIINDATMDDAIEAGIHKLTKVIDTGDGTPGVVLEDCSNEFIRAFSEADLIISKGQGNFETLSDIDDKKIYFLLKIKCEPVAQITGHKLGESVILCNRS